MNFGQILGDFEQILIPKRYRDKKTIEDKSAAGSAEHIVSDTSGVDTIKSDKDKWEGILLQVKVGITVTHEKFGNGTITWMSVDKKYMRVKFAAGEKQFVFPDAFLMEYLKLK